VTLIWLLSLHAFPTAFVQQCQRLIRSHAHVVTPTNRLNLITSELHLTYPKHQFSHFLGFRFAG
jgi:hypothetical protein